MFYLRSTRIFRVLILLCALLTAFQYCENKSVVKGCKRRFPASNNNRQMTQMRFYKELHIIRDIYQTYRLWSSQINKFLSRKENIISQGSDTRAKRCCDHVELMNGCCPEILSVCSSTCLHFFSPRKIQSQTLLTLCNSWPSGV